MKVAGFQDSKQDAQTVDSAGQDLVKLPVGVSLKEVETHIDDRGSVCEMYDLRWNWHPDPLVFAFMFTIRPGVTKGWGVHKEKHDRYFIMFGEMETVLYDGREDSKTFGLVAKICLSEYNRRLLSIPPGVWHADHNIGNKDVVVVNFPSTPYNNESPDKYRLPLDTDKIPYKFTNTRGG